MYFVIMDTEFSDVTVSYLFTLLYNVAYVDRETTDDAHSTRKADV